VLNRIEHLLTALADALPLKSGAARAVVLMFAGLGAVLAGGGLVRMAFELLRPNRLFSAQFPHVGIRLRIRLPRQWKRQFDASTPVLFRNRVDGSLLQVTLTPWLYAGTRPPKNLRAAVEMLRDAKLAGALETEVPVRDLQGTAEAYFFQCTDRHVEPGEWAFMTHGMIEQSGHMALFTVLSHHAPPTGSAQALAALRTLTLYRGPRTLVP
jgi:hypothetical protein